MLDRTYAEYAWEQTAALLAIDSPSGFTGRAAHWVKEAFEHLGFSAEITKMVHSSDSAAFADKGIPSIGISRRTTTAEIHTVHDTMATLCPKALAETADFAISFMERVINSVILPAELGMPDDLIDVLNKRFRG